MKDLTLKDIVSFLFLDLLNYNPLDFTLVMHPEVKIASVKEGRREEIQKKALKMVRFFITQ